MEDVLEIYHRPYNQDYPVVCMDESNKQLISETHQSLPTKPGMIAKQDHEYKRQGVKDIFLSVEALAGVRHTSVTDTRKSTDWAIFMKSVIDSYSKAKKIILIMDNLNTHTTASFYKAFPPKEALRLSQRIEIHHTPKHGSWLNIAECELSVLSRQCLNQRIATKKVMTRHITAWTADRNSNHSKIDWQFTTADARIKLKHLYPSF